MVGRREFLMAMFGGTVMGGIGGATYGVQTDPPVAPDNVPPPEDDKPVLEPTAEGFDRIKPPVDLFTEENEKPSVDEKAGWVATCTGRGAIAGAGTGAAVVGAMAFTQHAPSPPQTHEERVDKIAKKEKQRPSY